MGFENNKAYLTDIGGSPISNLSIFEIQVDRNVEITEQPIESGEQRQDSKVRQPITVTLSCGCKSPHWDGDVKTKLAALYKERTKKTCAVNTKAEFLKNLALVSFPYTVSPENYDVLMFDLTLKEVIIVGHESENDFSNSVNPENSSTVATASNVKSAASDTLSESATATIERQIKEVGANNTKLEADNAKLLEKLKRYEQEKAAQNQKIAALEAQNKSLSSGQESVSVK